MERTTISDLPVEIFIKIFEKLESPEIFIVAEVCRHWYLITQRAAIVNKTIVQFGHHQPVNCSNIDFFLNSSRKFQFRLLTIHYELPDNYCQFIQKFYENIIEFKFFNGIRLPSLEQIKCLKSLRNLEFYGCNIPSSLRNFTSNIVNLKNLKGLTLWDCSFEIESILPDDLQLNLTSLQLVLNKTNVCTLLSSIPSSSLKTLSVTYNDSNSIETVFKYLKNTKLTKSLTELYLDCLNNDVHDDIICQMNHLNLKKLKCGGIFNAGRVETFLSNQMNLERLELIRTVVNDEMLQIILKHLLNLQELKFSCECRITDFGITGNPHGFSITRLEKLKVFSLPYQDVNITNESIRLMESMKHLENVKLKKSQHYSSNDSRFKFC